MVTVLLLRLEFGVIVLNLNSNEVNALGRAGRTGIFYVMSMSSLACFAIPLVSTVFA